MLYGADGIICGHIHTPAIRRIRHVDYYNTGDWVESSTALVEHFDGRIELVHWRQPEPVALPFDAGNQSELLVSEPELVS